MRNNLLVVEKADLLQLLTILLLLGFVALVSQRVFQLELSLVLRLYRCLQLCCFVPPLLQAPHSASRMSSALGT